MNQFVDMLTAITEPDDLILIRPVEIYTGPDGRRCSEVDHQGIEYVRLGVRTAAGEWVSYPEGLDPTWRRILARSEERRTNVFFGPCPRLGPDGRFDRAWQIRTVRVLWADLDNCTVAEALDRCRSQGLPRPSIVVASGNGVHLYWILETPFLIDDTDPPLPVLRDWVDTPDGRRVEEYVLCPVDGERLLLGAGHKGNEPELSARALHAQDVLGGIGAKIGGDSVQNLDRLLRAPGTFNRKNQRSGREPIPCELVELNVDLRYAFEEFVKLAADSPSKLRREQLAKVPLPEVKRPSGKRLRGLEDRILLCQTTPAGSRSDVDFALCCYAVEHGIARGEVWTRVQGVGKFAEAGERYFDLTWEKAEGHTREQRWEKARQKVEKAAAKKDQAAATVDEEDPGLVRLLADEIQKHDHFAKHGGRLYRFAGGRYCLQAEEFIKGRVKSLCLAWGISGDWSSRRAAEVVEWIRVDCPELWEAPPLDVLNLANGLLRLSDRALLPHDPDHLTDVALPVKYDPEATCPAIEKFVGQVFPADAVALAWQMVAWLMIAYTAIQKAMLLIGEGANGKSTWLRLVLAFLGHRNTAALSLHRLEADKYAVARLVGKLANVCPDLPSAKLAGTSVFKSIVGGDTLLAERKFCESFEFTPFCRLIFSANHLPPSPDGSYAFFRRWIVVPFDRTFEPQDQIPRDVLDAMLSTPSELSGLLNKALDALPVIKQQNGLSEPESVRKAWSDFYGTTDPLAVWLSRYTIDDFDSFVPKSVLRAAYNGYAERTGKPAKSEKAFGSEFKRLRPQVEEKQRNFNGKPKVHCYVGIGLLHQESGGESQESRDSRDNSYLLARTEEKEGEGESKRKSETEDKDYPVNLVNPVNGNGSSKLCSHDFVEVEDSGWIRTSCRLCGKFLGRRTSDAV